MNESWNGIEFVSGSGKKVSENDISEAFKNFRATKSDTLLKVNRKVYEALKVLYSEKFDIRKQDNCVLSKFEIFIYD